MKFKKAEIQPQNPYELYPVRIVADAAISTVGMHGGRMLPLLLLDTSARPDIDDLIRLHQALGQGDVRTQWGQLRGKEQTVALLLSFIRPVELFMVLEVDIVCSAPQNLDQ